MRRQRLPWTYLVITALCILYGGYYSIRHAADADKGKLTIGLTILGIGLGMLALFLVLRFLLTKKKSEPEEPKDSKEEKYEEKEERPAPRKVEEERPAPTRHAPEEYEAPREREYEPARTYSSYDQTFYVRQVGYGTVLAVAGNRIRDVRNNVYYRIEGNVVKQEGSGPLFEINGSAIRDIFGGYLYEVSGNSIRKTFGGHFAEYNGAYITKVDLSEKYELGDRPSRAMLLAIVAILFGKY